MHVDDELARRPRAKRHKMRAHTTTTVDDDVAALASRAGARAHDVQVVKRWVAAALRLTHTDDDLDADDDLDRAERTLADVLFTHALKHTHRVVFAALAKANNRAVCRMAQHVVRRCVDALTRASTDDDRCDDGLGCLRACAVMCAVYASNPRSAFEQGVIEGVDEAVLTRALARGLSRMRDEKSSTTPECVDLLSECCSLAYDVLSGGRGMAALKDCTGDDGRAREVTRAREGLMRALMDALTLERSASRDAMVTAGVTVARVMVEEHADAKMAIEAFARGVYGRSFAAVETSTSYASGAGAFSRFGALAVVRGFIIASDARAMTTALFSHDGDDGADDDERKYVFMYDDVLPGICEAIEGAEDSHYRFHAAACLRSALEKTRAATMATTVADAPPEALLERVAWIISTHWDEPLGQTVREIQACFECLLDIMTVTANGDEFLHRVARQILARPVEQKGRYLALRVLLSRIGATASLKTTTFFEDDFLRQTLSAMSETSIAPAASMMLGDLCTISLEESRGDVAAWRSWWMDDVMYIFQRGSARAQSALTTYVVPMLLKLDPMSAIELMKRIERDAGASAVVAVLKVCRSLRMVDAESIALIKPLAAAAPDARPDDALATYEVPMKILEESSVSASTQLRLDVLELLCLDARKGAVTFPGTLELSLLRRMLPLNLRGESVSFRNTVVTLMSKFFTRTWTCVNNVAQKCRRRGDATRRGKVPPKSARAGDEDPLARDIARAKQCHAWVSELVSTLVMSIYPGAPFERRCTALDLLNGIAESWMSDDGGADSAGIDEADLNDDLRIARELLTSPYVMCTNKACTDMLLGALVDSWEKLRVTAFALLRRHPSPLAGLETPALLEARLTWAMDLLHSPRLRESDAGALLIRLLIRKYAYDMRWDIQLSPTIKVTPPKADGTPRADVGAHVLESMCDLLAHDIALAEADVMKACRQSLAHGAILLTRYAIQEINFDAEKTDALQAALTRMMALMTRATELALGFISQPDALGATAEEVKFESGGFDDGMDDDVADDDTMDDDTTDACDLAPRAQIITTACWLTVKEISLLTGEVTGATATADMLSLDALKSAGERLFNVLFTVKHTGAMEKTRIGTTALCARLMRSNDAALNMLPQQWLDELVTQLTRPGQGVRDRVRRSAGLPYAFMSILLAEPRGQTRVALERVLPQLLDVAAAPDGSESENIPRVHAFNVIRVIFADRDLSVETTAHAARGLEVCIRAFSSPAWETRNAATLAFASLLTKVCGCMNISPRRIRDGYVSSRREVSVVEFFQRFPSLHAYLLEELATATSMMTADSSLSVSSVHPSLYPTLALLSRLTPSSSSCDDEGSDAHAATNVKLSPSAFIPSVLTCASAKYLAVRAAAARALRPLVPPTEVAAHIASVLSPLSDAHEPPRVGCNTAHGALLCVHELLIEACCSSSSSSTMMWDVVRAASNGLTACAKTAATVRVPLISAAWLRCAEATALIANKFLVNTNACDALGDDGTFHELVLMMWQCSAPVLSAHAEHHPGASEWNKAAAGIRVRIALNCDSAYREYRYGRLCKTHDEWFGDDIGDVTEAIIDALGANTSYEYRAQAYKALFHGGDHLPMADETKDFVRNVLQYEERHSVVRRAIRVVTEWALGMSEGGDHHLLFWRVVLDITVNNINERVRSEGMCCLARLCAAQLRIDAMETVSSGRLNGFVRMILDGCDPSASSEKRKAAVQALSSSKLLDFVQGDRVKDEATSALAVDLWRCMLMLIEDEDVDIREIASETASSAIESVRSGAQSEEVLRAIFQHVHTNFAQFDVAMTFMVDLAKGSSYTRSQFDHVLARSTNIRRLFDKEADNAHAEPLFLAQLAAKQMHASCDAKTAQCALDEVMETLTNMTDALEAFASRDSRWVGGVTAHEDCFVPIANALIGAWAFEARIGNDDNERRERLQALYTALTPFVAPALRVLMHVGDVNADDVFASVSPCFLV